MLFHAVQHTDLTQHTHTHKFATSTLPDLQLNSAGSELSAKDRRSPQTSRGGKRKEAQEAAAEAERLAQEGESSITVCVQSLRVWLLCS